MSQTATPAAPKQISSIRRVTFYTACPVETCDRCGQGIKHVALVAFKDETFQRFGLDCINKILAGDNSLKSAFKKNQKLLQRYTRSLEILSMKPEEMPRGSEYYNSGIFMVGGNEFESRGDVWGEGGRVYFHPVIDVQKNLSGNHYRMDGRQTFPTKGNPWTPNTPENKRLAYVEEIESGKVWFAKEIERISSFLARVLNNAVAKSSVQLK
jgi:hypothetical protein